MIPWDFLLNPVTIGFVIGYITNDVAIRMIFRPHKKINFLGLKWQGLIPRRQPEIAEKIAAIVTTRLLTREKIIARFSDADVHASMEKMLREMLAHFIAQDFGSLGQLLSPTEKTRLAETIAEVLEKVGSGIEDWLATEAGHGVMTRMLDRVLQRCPEEILRNQNFNLEERLDVYIQKFMSQSGWRESIKQWMSSLVVDWANSQATLEESLPSEAHSILHGEIVGLAPLLQERIQQIIFTPENLEKIRQAVGAGVEKEFRKNVVNPNSFGGIVEMGAKALLKQPILDKVDSIFAANVPEMQAALGDAETRARLEAALEEFLKEMLKKTPNEVLAGRSPDSLDGILERLTDLAEEGLQKDEFRKFVVKAMADELRRLSKQPARSLILMAGFPDDFRENWTNELCTSALKGKISDFMKREGRWLFDIILAVPLGRISRFGDPAILAQAIGIAAEHVLRAVSEKAPQILEAVNMQEIIRSELYGYPPEELEKIVMAICSRELSAITWLGGVLGAAIGATQLFL